MEYISTHSNTQYKELRTFRHGFQFYAFLSRIAVFESDLRWGDMREYVYSQKYEYSSLCMQDLRKGGH
jgi:hypothetical protein